MKISIRTSILTLLLSLLLGTSLCFMAINYFVLDDVLIATGKDSISVTTRPPNR